MTHEPPAPAAAPEEPDSPVGLFLLTAFLGLLILLDWRLGGQSLIPGYSLRPALIAAAVGAVRVTFASLSGLLEGRIGADLALAIATWAALWIRQPFAAAEVVFIAMTGESLEAVAFSRTRRALERLLALWPQTACVVVDGEEREVPTAELRVGDRVVVRPGERVAVDGRIVLGETSLDESSLTGESLPVDRGVGDEVRSGTQNLHGAIHVFAEEVGAETILGRVVALVAAAQQRQAPVQRTADLYAAWFLPAVLLCAGLTLWATRDWMRTVAVLVVACPCALVLATPAAVLAGIGRLARRGVLVKSGEALETLARVRTLGFDKTGTLTAGRLEVGDRVPFGTTTAAELLRLAAAGESGAEHPLAQCFVEAARDAGLAFEPAEELQALPGLGVTARGAEGRLAVGNARLMEQLGIGVDAAAVETLERLAASGQTAVLVARDGRLVGAVGARDRLRPDAADTVRALHRLGLRRVALLTGDREAVAGRVAAQVGIDEVHAELLPADKAAWVRTRRNAGERVAMVGDGINDAPALAEADVGVAIAERGSDIAAEAADIVLLGDPLAQVPYLVQVCREVLGTIRLSILGFAFGLNGVAVLLSAWGKLSPVQAAVFHQAGSLAVLLNALRLLGMEPRPGSAGERAAGLARRWLAAALAFDLDGLVTWSALRWRTILRWKLRLLAGLWLLTCLVPVGAEQVAVIRVFGRHGATYGPGLWLKPWWPIGRARLLRPGEVRALELGFASVPGAAPRPGPGQYEWDSAHLAGVYQRVPDEALMLTGDANFVEVQAVVQYTVADPARYAFAAADVAGFVKARAETVLREVAAGMALDDVLTTARGRVEQQARSGLQAACDAGGVGVRIAAVELGDVHPPLEVVPAFRAVSSAYENKLQQINEAEAYGNEAVALARGEAAARRQAAEAYRVGRVDRARGEAARFTLRQQTWRAAPEVTAARLRLDAVERSLTGRRKLILDPAVTARRQFWTLSPDLQKLFPGQPAPAPSGLATEEAEEAPPAPAAPPAAGGVTP
ncbi:MAG: cation-translocating P-type ATPase family protein [Armatimonadetes bacterium]|nr:cation-translocating P-type ATPase family protein [Armatimonadota bacterium]